MAVDRAGNDVDSQLTRADGLRVGLLVLLATLLHAWLIGRTELVARDGVGFIRYALELEHHPWRTVVAHEHQHPLYPITVLAMSLPVRHLLGTTSMSMGLSAQLAAAVAGILLVIPMYLLGRALFDRRVGFWAAALFQCLPITARVTADALSDALCLVFVAMALWLGVRAVARASVWRFALCGLCAGLAYLARPEGILPVAAIAVVLLGMQATRTWCGPWRRWAVCTASLILAALVAGGPLVAVTGRLSTKPAAQRIMQSRDEVGQNGPTTGPLLAVTWTGPAGTRPSVGWSMCAVASETIRAFQYLAFLPALAGLWCCRARFRSQPGLWVLVALCLLQAAVLVRMGELVGYVSERHVLFLVLCGSYWAAVAATQLGDWLALRSRQRWAATALLGVLTAFGLPVLLKPLHANQVGHRTAGLWLAAHAQPADPILDWHSTAAFYAGRLFHDECQPLPTSEPVLYVVLEEPQRSSVPDWARPCVDEAVQQGTVVFRCPVELGRNSGQQIVIYASHSGSIPTDVH
jgi:hypothetical protein